MAVPMLQIGVVLGIFIVGGGVGFGFNVLLGESDAGSILTLLTWMGTVFTASIVGYSLMGMTVNMVDATLKGKKPNLGEAFADVRKNFVAITIVAGISAFVQILAGIARDRRNRGLVALLARALMNLVERV